MLRHMGFVVAALFLVVGGASAGVGTPKWSPDDALIAFWIGYPSRHPSCPVLRVVGSNGGNAIVRGLLICDGDPSWSPTGRRIAVAGYHDLTAGLFVLDVDSGRVQKVAASPVGGAVAWSPDGTTLAFTGEAGALRVHSLDGGAERVLARGDNPVWSPDGRLIAFESNTGVGLTDLSGIVTTLRENCARSPAWAPDSKRLAFHVYGCYGQSPGTPTGVVVADLATGRQTAVGDGFYPAWSPDGSAIAFGSRPLTFGGMPDRQAHGITVVASDGTSKSAITEYGWRPAWARDGERIAFAGPAGEVGQVYVVNRDGNGLRNISGDCPVTHSTPRSYLCIWDEGVRQSVRAEDAQPPLTVYLDRKRLDSRIWSRPCRCSPNRISVFDRVGNRVRDLRARVTADGVARVVYTGREPRMQSSVYGQLPFRLVLRSSARPGTRFSLRVRLTDERDRAVTEASFQMRIPRRPGP